MFIYTRIHNRRAQTTISRNNVWQFLLFFFIVFNSDAVSVNLF